MPIQLISYLQDTGFDLYNMREWLSGGAPPCQGGGRGFDPRLALFLFVAEALILQGFRSFYVVADLHPPAPSRFIVSAIMLFLINSVSPLSTRTQGIGNEYEVGKACVCPCMGAITDFPIVWCY